MAESLFEFTEYVVSRPMTATGHVATRRAWEDAPNGKRRPSEHPELDEQGRGTHIVDTLAAIGRDGQVLVVGVAVVSHEVPAPEPLSQVEFDGLRVRVKQHQSGKGVDVSYAADGVRPAGQPARGRRSAEGEAA